MPSFNKVNEQASALRCQNNLKQAGTGFYAFSLDNDETILPVSTGISLNRGSWISTLRGYLPWETFKDADYLLCPSFGTEETLSYSYIIYSGCRARGGRSYREADTNRYDQVMYNNISKPSEAITLFDNNGSKIHRADYFAGLGKRAKYYRHMGGHNRLYLDGHVQHGIERYELPDRNYWWLWSFNRGN